MKTRNRQLRIMHIMSAWLRGITIAGWLRLDPTHPTLFDRLDSRGAIFCSWSKVERKHRFGALLASFDPTYESHYAYCADKGEIWLLSPQELGRWEGVEWPDPQW